MAKCIVSFLDVSGIRHQVEVEAGSMYEAAAFAIRAFREHDCEPAPLNELEIEIRTSVTHTLTVKKLREWLNGGAKTPREVVIKDRLRELLQ
jgi:hypothetical protein